ncbi:MAG: hypothetical protein QQN55_01140 [Nitrosopumilus sp.]
MSTTTDPINVGTAPNDDTGDKIRTGGQIINANTVKLFNLSNKIDEGKMSIFKYTGNVDISIIQQKDVVSGIVEDGANKFFIESQYVTGDVSLFGTEAGNFNDGSYKNYKYRKLN